MLVALLLWLLGTIARVFLFIWPITWDLPAGVASAFSSLGAFIGQASAILPDGVLANLAAASAFVLTVQIFALPWLVARGFRLPFAALTKKD